MSTVLLGLCYPNHPPTHAHRATDDGGGGDLGSRVAPRAARGSVHDGIGGNGDCENGVAMCQWTLDVWWMKGYNGLAVVLRLSGSRSPSEWSVESRFTSKCSVESLDRERRW